MKQNSGHINSFIYLIPVILVAILLVIAIPQAVRSHEPVNVVGAIETREEAPYPTVDWQALKAVNEDVVGWITIPGTPVNAPIMAANFGEKDYYLYHDLNGSVSRAGSLYLDAYAGGVIHKEAPYESVIYGHHMSDGSMFAAVADYADIDFAAAHSKAYVQIPGHVYEYDFDFSEIVSASEEIVPSGFAGMDDYTKWIESRRANAQVDLGRNDNGQTLCLITCSYTTFENERSAAYFQFEKEIEG